MSLVHACDSTGSVREITTGSLECARRIEKLSTHGFRTDERGNAGLD